MKHYKPGQIVSINGILYRAKRREHGCKGCVLDDLLVCPCVTGTKEKPIDCSYDDIILVRV